MTTAPPTDTKNLLFLSLRGIMQKTKYPGVVQLIERAVWVREAGVRAAFPKNPGKLWDAKADGVLSLAGNWSKTGADPIFDHSWKIPYPGVAQLVARLLWEKPPGQFHNFISGCCAVGSAPALGAGGPGFESPHSDHLSQKNRLFRRFFCVFCYVLQFG